MIIAEVLHNADRITNAIIEKISSISSDAFWGIAGTIIGTLLGWLLSEFSNHGRLHCFVRAWHAGLYMSDHYGGYIYCKRFQTPEHFRYSLTIELTNNSRIPKLIRDGKIVLYQKKKLVWETIPFDKSTLKQSNYNNHYDDLSAFCVPATGVITLDLLGTITNKEGKFPYLEKANEVFFQYRNEKNRIQKWKIADINYDSYFDNDVEDHTNG